MFPMYITVHPLDHSFISQAEHHKITNRRASNLSTSAEGTSQTPCLLLMAV